MGRWQQREMSLSLDRQANASNFPVVPVLLPGADPPLGFLSLNTWVDLRLDPNDAIGLQVLHGAIRGQPPGPNLRARVATTLSAICPYRGLRPFREEDAPFFFGRETYTDLLEKTLQQRSMVAVVGASGSGKSTAAAGLIDRVTPR
jgi:hypothetical protein